MSEIEPFYRLLGEKLRAARQEAGMTQEQLAARLGFHGATITFYEKGSNRIRVLELIQMCAVLGADVHEVLASAMETPSLLIPGQRASRSKRTAGGRLKPAKRQGS